MVDDLVHDDLHAVGVGGLDHGLELLLGAELVVADVVVVGGLVVPPPLAGAGAVIGAHQGETAVVAHLDLVDRRGLDGGEARRGDGGDHFLDGVEVPAPGVEDGAAADLLGQTVPGQGPFGIRVVRELGLGGKLLRAEPRAVPGHDLGFTPGHGAGVLLGAVAVVVDDDLDDLEALKLGGQDGLPIAGPIALGLELRHDAGPRGGDLTLAQLGGGGVPGVDGVGVPALVAVLHVDDGVLEGGALGVGVFLGHDDGVLGVIADQPQDHGFARGHALADGNHVAVGEGGLGTLAELIGGVVHQRIVVQDDPQGIVEAAVAGGGEDDGLRVGGALPGEEVDGIGVRRDHKGAVGVAQEVPQGLVAQLEGVAEVHRGKDAVAQVVLQTDAVAVEAEVVAAEAEHQAAIAAAGSLVHGPDQSRVRIDDHPVLHGNGYADSGIAVVVLGLEGEEAVLRLHGDDDLILSRGLERGLDEAGPALVGVSLAAADADAVLAVVMAQGVDGIIAGFAAAQAGVGIGAVSGAARLQGLLALVPVVPEGRDGYSLGVAADGAGIEDGAVFGASGLGGSHALVPLVLVVVAGAVLPFLVGVHDLDLAGMDQHVSALDLVVAAAAAVVDDDVHLSLVLQLEGQDVLPVAGPAALGLQLRRNAGPAAVVGAVAAPEVDIDRGVAPAAVDADLVLHEDHGVSPVAALGVGGADLGDLLALGVEAGDDQGGGVVVFHALADGHDGAVDRLGGLAVIDGVAGVVNAAHGDGDLQGVGDELGGGNGQGDLGLEVQAALELGVVDHRDLAGAEGAGDLAVGDGEGPAVDLIGVAAVGHALHGSVLQYDVLAADVDDDSALVTALDHHDVVGAGGVAEVFLGAAHFIAEEIHRDDLGIHEEVAALGADLVVAVGAGGGGVHGTAEEQGGALLPGRQDRPGLDDLLLVQLVVAVVVDVVVVGLDPGDGAVGARALGNQHVAHIGGVQIAVVDRVAQTPAVEGEGGVEVLLLAVLGQEGLGLIGVQAGAVLVVVAADHVGHVLPAVVGLALLQGLAVLEGGAVLQYGGPEVRGEIVVRVVDGNVVRQLDQLGRVVAEAVRAGLHAGLEPAEDVLLHVGVLGVPLDEAGQGVLGLLKAVPLGPVGAGALVGPGLAGVAPFAGLAPVDLIADFVGNGALAGGHVVHNLVHDDLHAVGVGHLAHLPEFLVGAQLIVADDLILGGLIVVVPLALADDLQTAVFSHDDGVDGRGLDRGEARRGNLGDHRLDGVEVPAPGVENCAVLDDLRQAILVQALVRGFFFRQRLVQEGDDLRSGAELLRTEGRLRGAAGDAVRVGPEHSLVVVLARRHILKGIFNIDGRTAGEGPEEGHNFGAGAALFGTEGACRSAAGDSALHSPENGAVVVLVRRYIRKRIFGVRLLTTGRSPKEGHDLRPGAGFFGTEGGRCGSAGDTVLDSPVYGFLIVSVFRYVLEYRSALRPG